MPAATYRVVHLTRRQDRGWAVEISAPGKKTQTRGFYETEAEARIEANRLAALDEARES